MTFPQIAQCVAAIEIVRVGRLVEIAQPILEGLGGGKVKVDGAPANRAPMSKTKDGGTAVRPYAMEGEEGESMLRVGLGMLGFGVQQQGDPDGTAG